VVVCHHDGGHARFPSKLRRLFQRLHLQVTIDYVGLDGPILVIQRSGMC
jgi:hypothetical protein